MSLRFTFASTMTICCFQILICLELRIQSGKSSMRYNLQMAVPEASVLNVQMACTIETY